MKYDLHIHSNLSDGCLSKYDVVQLAKEKNLEVISFTDHNKYNEFYSDIPIIKGIEFDCNDLISFHLLVYFNEYTEELKKLVKKYEKNVTKNTIELINSIRLVHNVSIPINEMKKPITKRDVIDYLVKNEYAATIDEASSRFTGKMSKSYVKKFSLDFNDFTGLNKNNVTLVLAHPSTLNLNADVENKFIYYLVEKGLDGIEIYNSSKINRNQIERYLKLAKKYDLITTSGSDFHNFKNNELGVDNEFSKKLIIKHI